MSEQPDKWQWYREHPLQAILLTVAALAIWAVIIIANIPLGLG